MKPTIGRIVIYHTTKDQRTDMENRSYCNEQVYLPAVIVAVWSDTMVNLKVFLDGMDDLWVISSLKGDEEMEWNWPVINK